MEQRRDTESKSNLHLSASRRRREIQVPFANLIVVVAKKEKRKKGNSFLFLSSMYYVFLNECVYDEWLEDIL